MINRVLIIKPKKNEIKFTGSRSIKLGTLAAIRISTVKKIISVYFAQIIHILVKRIRKKKSIKHKNLAWSSIN